MIVIFPLLIIGYVLAEIVKDLVDAMTLPIEECLRRQPAWIVFHAVGKAVVIFAASALLGHLRS